MQTEYCIHLINNFFKKKNTDRNISVVSFKITTPVYGGMSQPCAGVYSVHVYSGVLRHVHVCSCVFMHIYMSCVHAKGFFLVCEHHLLVSHVLGFFFS